MSDVAELLRSLILKVEGLAREVTAGREENAALREQLEYREKVLVGLEAIGEYLGHSGDWALRMSKLEFDPLPANERRGLYVTAKASALDAWIERYRARVTAKRVSSANRRWSGERRTKRGRAEDGSAS